MLGAIIKTSTPSKVDVDVDIGTGRRETTRREETRGGRKSGKGKVIRRRK